MNRRIIYEAQEHWGWRLVKGLLIFIAAVAVAALLSIDDFETTEGHHGAQEER